MKWREQHEAFKRLLIQGGIQRMEQVSQALPFGCTVPFPRINRWLMDMLRVPVEFSTQRRYVNHFKLGADPEFIFLDGGNRIDAYSLSLHQGLAFGQDNNGRLTELRPYPSRSALEVVASIMAELRWLAIFNPTTLKYAWIAGAYVLGDGLGGHVHFGRKRPNRSLEVKALDTIDDELLALRAYPVLEVQRRRLGDEHHNAPYGLPGDIRPQAHGYEYRTLPSWLDSPELAFLSIVLSKLAVHNPSLVQGYAPQLYDRHFQRIRNLLSYYKDVDDDARLALAMIVRKMPMHIGGDFRPRWGLPSVLEGEKPKVVFIPTSIKPSNEDITEMFEHLIGRKSLVWRIPTPTWEPLVPPENYWMVIGRACTRQAKGLGELIWDVVTHKSITPSFQAMNGIVNKAYFSIPRSIARQLPFDWKRLSQYKVVFHEGDEKWIYVSAEAREPKNYKTARHILLETILPFWKVTEVKKDSFQQWQSAHQKIRPDTRYAGQVLYGSQEVLPLKGA